MGSEASSLETLRFDLRGRAAWVTLSRPEALNGITMEMLAELAVVCDRIERDERILAAVVTGSDSTFSVGADIDLLKRAFRNHDYFREFLETINRVLLRIETLPVPVIAAVNGLARAGGFELLLACDLVLVADGARLGDNHTQFGVMPGGGASQRAPRKLGDQVARELIFTARWLSGPEAVQRGIALRSVPDAGLVAAVDELLASIVDKPRACLAAVKRAMARGANLPVADAVAVEMEEFLRYLKSSPDMTEGFDAYLERREPSWKSA